MAIPSSFEMSVNGFFEGPDYTVVVSIDNVEPYSGSNIVLQFAISESDCSFGGDTYNFVTRFLAPNQNGTPLDFSTTTSQAVELNFSLDAGWVPENCEFVAFIQDNSGKEILQATKVGALDLLPLYFDDAGCVTLAEVPVVNCVGEIAPKVTISSGGIDDLTSLDINYQVNEETVNVYQWTGNLGYGEMEEIMLPAASFDVLDLNDLIVYTSNPNGNPDEDPTNDTLSSVFSSSMSVVPNIFVFIKLDDNPEETTWNCKNSSGDVLFSGGPYSNPGQFIKDTLFLSSDDCYTFSIYDEGGDGLVGGTAGFSLRQNNFGLIYENNDFEYSEELVQFEIDQVAVPEIDAMSDFSIYPNPFEDYTNVSFNLTESAYVELSVYNIVGEVVYQTQLSELGMGSQKLLLDTQNYKPGIYFVNLIVGDKVYTKKITSF